jgi:glycerophosphoryl diester phosphodiesterase
MEIKHQTPIKPLLVYAHRGASGYFPENTLLAFEKAVEMGAEAIEFDLILTTDGHYVIHHDFLYLDEVQNRFDLRKMSRPEIENHINSKLKAATKLAFLDELLAIVPPNLILNAELKTAYPQPYRQNVRHLCAFLEAVPNRQRILVSSFHIDAMIYLQKISTLPTAYLFMAHKWGQFLSRRALWAGRLPNAVHLEWGHPHLKLWLKRLPVSVFTINDAQRAHELAMQGVRGIFSDFPDRFIQNQKG